MGASANRPLAVLFSILLLSAFTGGGCSGPEKELPAPPGKTSDDGPPLRIVIFSWPLSFNPYLSRRAEDRWIFRQIFEGLVDVTMQDGKPVYVPRLATSWSFSEDGKELTFQLRKGVQWHDGKPFTSRDVVKSCDLLKNRPTTAYHGLLDKVEAVLAKGPDRVVVRYKEPFAPALSTFTVPILPAHWFQDIDDYDAASRRFPAIGTGPFRIAARVKDDSIVLKRFSRYHSQKPHFGKLVFRMMPDTSAALEAIRENRLDVTRMRPADWRFNTPAEEWGGIIQKIANPTYGYTYLGWNCRGPILSDRSIRRALAMLFDANQARSLYLSGFGEIAYGPYPSWSPYFDPDLKPLPTDTVGAKRILASLGFIDHDGDGIRDRDGIPLKLKILTIDNMLFTNEVADYFSRRLKTAGVDLRYVRVTYPELLSRIGNGRFDGYILRWSGDSDPDIYDIFHSQSTGKGSNYGGYLNEEVDQLIERGRGTLDEGERTVIYRRAARLIYDDQPYLFLFFSPELWAVSKRIEGVSTHPSGLLTGYPGILAWSPAGSPQPSGERPPEKGTSQETKR